MKASEPLGYTEDELRSFLPSGWHLAFADDANAELGPRTIGLWDARKRAWQTRILDNVDFDWPLVVTAIDVASAAKLGGDGRIEALRLAMDRLYRERLG